MKTTFTGFIEFSSLILQRENLSASNIREPDFWIDLINSAIDLDEDSTLVEALSRFAEFYENVLQELILERDLNIFIMI